MIQGVELTDLSMVMGESGAVHHFMRASDPLFVGFGEVYFSTIDQEAVRAWKMHRRMTLNLVVPIGRVLFNFLDPREDSPSCGESSTFVLSRQPWQRLTVSPGIWFGFKGLEPGTNLICNQADLIHDPGEVMRKPLSAIEADWSPK